jgi:hypothetical protein
MENPKWPLPRNNRDRNTKGLTMGDLMARFPLRGLLPRVSGVAALAGWVPLRSCGSDRVVRSRPARSRVPAPPMRYQFSVTPEHSTDSHLELMEVVLSAYLMIPAIRA